MNQLADTISESSQRPEGMLKSLRIFAECGDDEISELLKAMVSASGKESSACALECYRTMNGCVSLYEPRYYRAAVLQERKQKGLRGLMASVFLRASGTPALLAAFVLPASAICASAAAAAAGMSFWLGAPTIAAAVSFMSPIIITCGIMAGVVSVWSATKTHNRLESEAQQNLYKGMLEGSIISEYAATTHSPAMVRNTIGTAVAKLRDVRRVDAEKRARDAEMVRAQVMENMSDTFNRGVPSDIGAVKVQLKTPKRPRKYG